MLIAVLVFGFLLKSGTSYGFRRQLDIPSNDLIGWLTRLGSTFLEYFVGPVQGIYSETCKVYTIAIAGTEVKVSLRPHGTCIYCCIMGDPRRHITLYIHKKNGTTRARLIRRRGYLNAKGVDSTIPTVLYIHGFTEHALGVSSKGVSDAYLLRNDSYNVLSLDWSSLAVFPWYSTAANNTIVVSTALAQFLRFYNARKELRVETVHLIGFSLGSHVAGYAGRMLKGKLGRITALDPAFPEFPLDDSSQIITKVDANYVDVIHTDSGRYGFPKSIGHSDFYPNGGKLLQPGCKPSELAEEGNILAILICNHFHAWRFYAESVINPSAFPATRCGISENGRLTSCPFTVHGYMGFPANKSVLGNFYLTTKGKYPYANSAENQMFQNGSLRLVL